MLRALGALAACAAGAGRVRMHGEPAARMRAYLSTAAGGGRDGKRPPTLKKQLKKLYLLVHPDLFENHPEQKDVNARSLAALMRFVDDVLKPERSRGDDAEVAWRDAAAKVDFWIRDEEAAQEAARQSSGSAGRRASSVAGQDPETASTPAPVRFRLVSAMLRSSGVRGGPFGRFGTANLFHSSLAALFAKCGLESDFVLHEGEAAPYAHGNRTPSLPEFLSHAGPAARAKAHQAREGDRAVHIAETSLRMLFVPRLLFEQPIPSPARLQALQDLRALLEEAPRHGIGEAAMQGLRRVPLVFGSASGVDPRGRLVLGVGEGPERWAAFLRAADVDAAADTRASLAAVADAEADAARRLGLASVFAADAGLLLSPGYGAFLAELARAGPGAPWLGTGEEGQSELDCLSLHVLPGPEAGQEGESFALDGRAGIMRVPVSTPSAEVVALLAKDGRRAAAARRHALHDDALTARLLDKARGRLRVRSIAHDVERVSPRELRACAERLVAHAPRLQPQLAEHALLIGRHYGVTDDGRVVIPWDFTL